MRKVNGQNKKDERSEKNHEQLKFPFRRKFIQIPVSFHSNLQKFSFKPIEVTIKTYNNFPENDLQLAQ